MTGLIALLAAVVIAGAPVEQAFVGGETLDYNLHWMKISGGSARMTIGLAPDDPGRYRISSVGKSNPGFSRVFHVRDHIETVVTRSDFSTVYYRKQLNEKGRRKDEVTVIADGVATRTASKTKQVKVPTPVMDPISVIYFLRTADLSVGKSHELTLISDGKIYEVRAKVLRRERIQTPAGVFNTVVVEPQMESSHQPRDERLWVWYSDDERRLPVRIRTEVAFGAITATLRAVTPGVSSIEPPAE